MSKTFKLSKPITINGKNGVQQVSEIEFRDPTAREVRKLGQFVRILRIGDAMEIKADTAIVAEWMATLSGLGTNEIDDMALPDWQAVFDWMSEKFGAVGN